jgi:hypothetical protein
MSCKGIFETPTEVAHRLYANLPPNAQAIIGPPDAPLRAVVAPGNQALVDAYVAKTVAKSYETFEERW